MTCLPRAELERPGDQDGDTNRDRNGARERRLLHLDRRQRGAERKGSHSEQGPHEEVPQAHQRGQAPQALPACPADGLAKRHSIGTRDGSIIATIITTHIPRNDAAAPTHVCPGIRIQAIDIVQPPGIGIPPIADIDAHHTIVTAALAANSSAETPKKARWEVRSQSMR
jgi:hypothetical protein